MGFVNIAAKCSSCMPHSICFIIFYLYTQAYHCEAKGSIKVELLFYKNPTGKDQQGECCDRTMGLVCIKKDGCDHTFNVCIDEKGK